MTAVSGMLFDVGVALPLLATRVFHQGGGGYGVMEAFGPGPSLGRSSPPRVAPRRAGARCACWRCFTSATVLATAAAPDLALELVGRAGRAVISI